MLAEAAETHNVQVYWPERPEREVLIMFPLASGASCLPPSAAVQNSSPGTSGRTACHPPAPPVRRADSEFHFCPLPITLKVKCRGIQGVQRVVRCVHHTVAIVVAAEVNDVNVDRSGVLTWIQCTVLILVEPGREDEVMGLIGGLECLRHRRVAAGEMPAGHRTVALRDLPTLFRGVVDRPEGRLEVDGGRAVRCSGINRNNYLVPGIAAQKDAADGTRRVPATFQTVDGYALG